MTTKAEAIARARALGVRFVHLPRWAPMAGLTLGRFVLLAQPADAALIAHELVHVEQQRRDGLVRFLWRYVARRSWRARYEAEAYAVDVARGRLTPDEAAERLAGWLYLWPCSRERARVAIEAWARRASAAPRRR